MLKKIIFYFLDFFLSNKYSEVIIQSLDPKIFDMKVEVLFCNTIKIEKKLNFLIEYLRF